MRYSAISASVSISAMLMISCIIVFALVLTWAAKNQNHLLVVFIFVKADPTGCARVPTENAVFMGNAHRHAWRIRRQTISKPAKTDIVNRVFASRFGYWLSRGDVGPAILRQGFV